MVSGPPAVQETQVPSLGGEDPLEEEMATHSSALAWKVPWAEGPGGGKESDTTERLTTAKQRLSENESKRNPS